jgi:hypothetical protein
MTCEVRRWEWLRDRGLAAGLHAEASAPGVMVELAEE